MSPSKLYPVADPEPPLPHGKQGDNESSNGTPEHNPPMVDGQVGADKRGADNLHVVVKRVELGQFRPVGDGSALVFQGLSHPHNGRDIE